MYAMVLIWMACQDPVSVSLPGYSHRNGLILHLAAYLEEKLYKNVIGCDSLFVNNTLTKNGMKEIFKAHLVASPPGFAVTKETDIAAEVEANGMVFPLFVKISDSYGSVGLDDNSVCHDLAQLENKCAKLLNEFPTLTVEEFIDGPEFSVLVSGNCRDPGQNVIVYPPAERAFNKKLGKYQRFISFERNWDEGALAHSYEPVQDSNDYNALQDIARRAYTAVSGNCYGRVDVRKRDINGKYYVLEVNASCGLGHGSSSEFILHLAGQTTKDFFEILLSSALKPNNEEFDGEEGEESEIDRVPDLRLTSVVLPTSVEEKVAKMIKNPSLAIIPTPVIHVVVSGVLQDAESGIPDPEGKLAQAWGKDAEYVSELEGIFRGIGYDPIVHLYHVDPIEEILAGLSTREDVVVNACLGTDGLEVAKMVENFSFNQTVGLNARFFNESRERDLMRRLLLDNRLRVPKGFEISKNDSSKLDSLLIVHGVEFPVYVKPSVARTQPHGKHSGKKVSSLAELKESLTTLGSGEKAIVEEFIVGNEYRILVAGDARDPFSDVLVFPPVHKISDSTKEYKSSENIFEKEVGSTKALSGADRHRPMVPDELMLQMDLQDFARRAYVAVHGSCYGIVTVIDKRPVNSADDQQQVLPSYYGGNELYVVGVSGDVRFGENAKAGTVLSLANLNAEALFAWLLKRPVRG